MIGGPWRGLTGVGETAQVVVRFPATPVCMSKCLLGQDTKPHKAVPAVCECVRMVGINVNYIVYFACSEQL